MTATIMYRMYPFVHRFANGVESQRVRTVALEWAKTHNISIQVEIIAYSVYIQFPDEQSLTLYALTVEGIDHSFSSVDSIPK
jgi:hypothetical protein